jgi:hypothetical protein
VGGGVTSARSLSFDLPPAATEQESFEAVLDCLAPLFERVPAVDGERDAALLVVSDDAGTGTTVRFWRDALAVGVGLASPGAFPWCLANAPCATLARRFGITGPNLTWLTSFADSRSAFDAPSAWMEDWLRSRSERGEVSEAWLVALHFGEPHARVSAWHWSGTKDVSARELRDVMASDWHAHPAPLCL